MQPVAIVGAGLAGSEAALQLADAGIPVRLYDLKPARRSPAHHSNQLAEIVCSNSFGSQGVSASGLVKREMLALGCQLLRLAQDCAVPAGQALAVDRDRFSARVTERLTQHPNITLIPEEVTALPTDCAAVILATGPMTTPGLTATLGQLVNRQQLYFFDAAAPIVTKESINFDVAFFQDRYGHTAEGQTANSYINCPLDRNEYEALLQFILEAEKTPLKAFEEAEKASFFESCMPVEVIASRGPDTLRYGPMKPVGLKDPRTGKTPYAVVQLRQDNAEGTLYNLVGFQTNIKWGAQKEMIRRIPGLENAEVVRYGVMHRNTYLHSPDCLQPTLQLTQHPQVWVAGQLTGTEGYTESIACGLYAAKTVQQVLAGQTPTPLPRETMMGALFAYITRPEAQGKDFQPINSNWGIMPPLMERVRDKKQRAAAYVARSQRMLQGFAQQQGWSFAWPETLSEMPAEAVAV